MSHFLSLIIASRYGKSHNSFARFISRLSAIGIILGVMALIIIISVMNGLQNNMVTSLLDTVPQAQITTKQGYFNPAKYPIKDFTPYLKNIQAVTPLVTAQVMVQNDRSLRLVTLLGITPSTPDPIANKIADNLRHSLSAGAYSVIVGASIAEQLGLQVGDKIRLIVPNATILTPIGRIPSQRIFTVSGIFSINSYVDSNFILVNQQDAAKLLQYPTGDITSWRLYLKNPLKIASVFSGTLPDHFISQDWRATQGDLFNAVKIEKRTMTLLMSLIIIVATFNVIASLSLLVMDKQKEIAILQTLGITRYKILGIFMLRGVWAGLIGTILGIILGISAALNINVILNLFGISILGIQLPVIIHPLQVFMIGFASITITLIATLYPAWYAANQKPAEVLRYE